MAGFQPIVQGTFMMNVTAVSSTITLPDRPGTVRIYNGGLKTAYIELGAATAVVPTGATYKTNTGGIPLASGAGSIPLLLEKGMQGLISAICAGADTTTLYITAGHGDTVG